LSPIPFNAYRRYFAKEALKGFGGFKIGAQVIHTVKYADGIVLLAKGKNSVTGQIFHISYIQIFNRQIEIGKRYDMETNMEKVKPRESQHNYSQHRL